MQPPFYHLVFTRCDSNTMENMQVNSAAGQRRIRCCVKRQLKTTKIIWSRFDDTNITVTMIPTGVKTSEVFSCVRALR